VIYFFSEEHLLLDFGLFDIPKSQSSALVTRIVTTSETLVIFCVDEILTLFDPPKIATTPRVLACVMMKSAELFRN